MLNRYGISTEYSGKVIINMNIVVQSKEVLEIERSKIREIQGIENFNLYSQIGDFLGSKDIQDDIIVTSSNREIEENQNLMKTSGHGVINRFSK